MKRPSLKAYVFHQSGVLLFFFNLFSIIIERDSINTFWLEPLGVGKFHNFYVLFLLEQNI